MLLKNFVENKNWVEVIEEGKLRCVAMAAEINLAEQAILWNTFVKIGKICVNLGQGKLFIIRWQFWTIWAHFFPMKFQYPCLRIT